MTGLRRFPHHSLPGKDGAARKAPLADARRPAVRRVGVALPIEIYVGFKTRVAREGRTGESVITELIRAWATACSDSVDK